MFARCRRKGSGGSRSSTGILNGRRNWPGSGATARAVGGTAAGALPPADLVLSTTGAGKPVVTRDQFAAVEARQFGRPLLILDLAVPRDFEPSIGDRPDVYLYSIDDLQAACGRTARRDKELPAACTSSGRRRPDSWPKCTIARLAR